LTLVVKEFVNNCLIYSNWIINPMILDVFIGSYGISGRPYCG
jgi:hypothetical protein